MTNATSLYERLGEGGSIKAVVDRFYEHVTADPMLAGYFADVNIPRLRRHQAAFLSQALGGPSDYDGRDMAAAHTALAISGPAFDRVVEHLVETLKETGVPPAEIEEIGQQLVPLRDQIVTV